MALDTILITDIINAPEVTAGLGGWDAVIRSEFANLRGRHRYGLLTRIPNINFTSPATLIVAPPGWIVCPLQVLVYYVSGTWTSMQISFGSNSNTDEWHDTSTLASVDTTGEKPLLFTPEPDTSSNTGQFTSPTNPTPIPVYDGDAGDEFVVNSISGGTNPVGRFDIYGVAYPKSDD